MRKVGRPAVLIQTIKCSKDYGQRTDLMLTVGDVEPLLGEIIRVLEFSDITFPGDLVFVECDVII